MASITKQNIDEFQKKLLNWFKLNMRNFPWRSRGLTVYHLIIAEVLLQRTKAETVANFYPKFIQDFPSWQSLGLTSIESIEQYLMPIGLYKQRAIRLKKLALEMVKRNGKVPSEREELESIPFMGQYIANAVELIIHGKRLPLIDVNMARVLERYFGKRKMADIRYDPYLQKLAFKVANHTSSKELNWAIIDFAALICKARSPLCKNCMLTKKCTYNRLNLISKKNR